MIILKRRFKYLVSCVYSFSALAITLIANPSSADLLPVTQLPVEGTQSIKLVEDGTSNAVVLITEAGQFAGGARLAQELVECIAERTGATLPIIQQAIPQGPAIIIGDGPEARAAGIDVNTLPPEGYIIKTVGNKIYLVGSTGKHPHGRVFDYSGNIHAIASFLERFVGVRWYWSKDMGGRYIPKSSNLIIPPSHFTDAPHFPMRDIWPIVERKPFELNQKVMYQMLGDGRSWPFTIQCHTPRWERNEDYAANHPEVYSLRADGTRNFHMLCYSHPKTLELYLTEIDQLIANPDAYDRKARYSMVHVTGTSITVSPADLGVTCRCEYCTPLYEAEKGQFASASKLMGLFVQKLAKKIKTRHPDHIVSYLPYLNYTLAPTDLNFPDNVEVELCGMPGMALYKEPLIAEQFQQNIDNWNKLTRRRSRTWEYSCWPNDRIKANYGYSHTVKAYYQRNHDKLVGSFINGTGTDWNRFHVSMYNWMKVLWNPDYNVDAMLAAYPKNMYGSAAADIARIIKIQHQRWEEVEWGSNGMTTKLVYEESFTPEIVAEIKALLASAKAKVAGDPLLEQRFEYFSATFPDFFEEAEAIHSGKGLKQLVARKVGHNPIVDGKLDDDAWDIPTGLPFHPNGEKAPARYPTEVKAVWTLDGVTFGFHLAEPNPEQLIRNLTGRDEGDAWLNDNVEIFLNVTADNNGSYYQWIINPNGTDAIWDGYNSGGNKIADDIWNGAGVKAVSHIGTDDWSLEVYIPYSAFDGNIELPSSGTGIEWPLQLTRHRMSSSKGSQDKNDRGEYTRLGHKFGGPSNNTGDFGVLKFQE